MHECSLGNVFVKKEAVKRIRKEEKVLMIIANNSDYSTRSVT
jgi:hypothetical protein